jgi:hypothetical protein
MFRKLFCLHKYEFIRNFYGYECMAKGYMRSLWICRKCDKRKLKSKSHRG